MRHAFWRWQERTAGALWDLALRTPPWPPQSAGETRDLLAAGLDWLSADPIPRPNPSLLADALRPVAAHLAGAPPCLRQFVDAQLLIAAQATSAHANALYGASALDLPRRGVVHLRGVAKAEGATTKTIFTLPPGFRPAAGPLLPFAVACLPCIAGGGTGTLLIAQEGPGTVEAPAAEDVSLEGVTFRAES